MRKDIIAIICPDVHGRTFWKNAAEEYDGSVPFIFLGDYLDPYKDEGITDEDAKNNFNEIWEFKQKWGDKVIMLLGNHDMSYYNSRFRCCRFSMENSEWYGNFIRDNFEHFKFVHGLKNNDTEYLLSHAGVNPFWLQEYNMEEIYNDDYINSLFTTNPASFETYSFFRGGYDIAGSPIWADIREYRGTKEDFMPENTQQIVGHTQLNADKLEYHGVTCIDSRQVFVITNDNKIEKISKTGELLVS